MYRVEGEPMSSSNVLVPSRRHTLTNLISRKDTNDTSQLGNSAESPAAHIYEIQLSAPDAHSAVRRHHGGYRELPQ